MSYVVENGLLVDLNFTVGPYTVPINPLDLDLDFADDGGAYYPLLPWAAPTLSIEYAARMQQAGSAFTITTLPITRAIAANDERGSAWGGRAFRGDAEVRVAHEDAEHVDDSSTVAWGLACAMHASGTLPWQKTGSKDAGLGQAWGWAEAVERTGYISSWIMNTPARDVNPGMGWFSVNLTGTPYDDAAAIRALLNTDTATTVTLDGFSGAVEITKWDEVDLQFGYVAPDRPIVPHDKAMRVTARQATERDGRKRIPWGTGQSVWQDWNLPYPVEENEQPPPEPTDPPERKTVYLIMNTLQISDVATGTPLDIQDVRISLDIDSLSWKFSGTVYGAGSLALVRPDNDGMKDITVTINGHTWTFAIESYTSDEKFPTQKFALSGLSRTQYMAAPFAPIRSYTNTLATTAAQAATAELTNTGFELNWPTGDDGDLPDWPIPAGALSYRDKSPAQVIAQIVTAAGGIMVPARAADAWTIQPRYTVAPWAWSEPDVIIYIGMVRSRSAKYEPAPAFDACYVSGINQGVAVDVQRAGSGGLNPMPDIYDDLITDQQPAISRGRAELSGAGNKVIETLSIMIPENGAAPGIVTPGQIAKITHDNPLEDYFALVLSTSISVQRAGGAEIYQSVTLERTA